jgi:hypothetical protein
MIFTFLGTVKKSLSLLDWGCLRKRRRRRRGGGLP